MKFMHRFTVRAPIQQVAEFHQSAGSMAAITPPPIFVQMHESPAQLTDGAEMEFTLWMLFVPIRWRARLEQVSQSSFWDRQLSGPYGSWVHRHTFVALDAERTEVLDEIHATLPDGVLAKLRALSMWIGMPILFTYRAWRTRHILERQHAAQPAISK